MDTGDKPTYNPTSCPLCKKLEPGQCGNCQKTIPQYVLPSGANTPVIINDGFRSPTPHHFHNKMVEGVPGVRVVNPSLCRECYAQAYNKAFPKAKLKIDDLPREFVFK